VHPQVTVIVPTFNSASYIAQSLESIIAQSFGDWECLVIEDFSTDHNADIVGEYSRQDTRVRFFRQERNCGAGSTRNVGIENSTGRYLAFLDSDDLWLPQKLEKQLAFMQATGTPLSYTNFFRVNESCQKTVGHVISPDTISYADLLQSCQIGCSTAVYDTHFAGKLLMPLIRRRQDWGLWLKVAKSGAIARNVGLTLAKYRVRSGSISRNKFVAMASTWRFYKEVVELPVGERIWRTLVYGLVNSRKYLTARNL
jgi:glycosyltransferase involved in cell wall biosynthesis